MEKKIQPLGKVAKCPKETVLTKGPNPEFYEFALLPLPLNWDDVFIKSQEHWFHLQNGMICYDKNGLPVLAIQKNEYNDQEFGVSLKEGKHEDKGSSG